MFIILYEYVYLRFCNALAFTGPKLIFLFMIINYVTRLDILKIRILSIEPGMFNSHMRGNNLLFATN